MNPDQVTSFLSTLALISTIILVFLIGLAVQLFRTSGAKLKTKDVAKYGPAGFTLLFSCFAMVIAILWSTWTIFEIGTADLAEGDKIPQALQVTIFNIQLATFVGVVLMIVSLFFYVKFRWRWGHGH